MRLRPAFRISLLAPFCAAFFLTPATSVSQEANDPATASLMKQGHDDLASHHYEDALKAFKKANQISHSACSDCYIQMAVAETHLGQLDDAVKNCDKAISCASDDRLRVEGHALKGNLLRNIGNDPKKLKESADEYAAAIQLDPKQPELHLNLGIVLLQESQESDGIAELNKYLASSPSGPDALYAKKLVANPKRAGDPLAPGFSVRTLDDQQISLDQLSGKIVVMDFWATWCPPCREAVPEFKELTKKYPPSKLVLISFSADSDQQAWRDFISKHDMEWPQYWDHDGAIAREFGVHAFPTYLVIDQDGFILDRIVGLNPQMSVVGRLKSTLQTLLPN